MPTLAAATTVSPTTTTDDDFESCLDGFREELDSIFDFPTPPPIACDLLAEEWTDHLLFNEPPVAAGESLGYWDVYSHTATPEGEDWQVIVRQSHQLLFLPC